MNPNMVPANTKAIRFYSRRELTDTHAGWKEIVPTIHAKVDDTLGKVENLACKPGCAHCCKLTVEALPHECMEVVDHIRFSDRFSREARATILDKLRDAVTRTEGLDAAAYRALDLSCPFLGDNNLCMVYSVRPFACRSFGSVNVGICDLSVPDDGQSTFKAVPDMLLALIATSGLFFTPFLKGCLSWWEGRGIESPTEMGEVEQVGLTQQRLDRAIEAARPRIKRIGGVREENLQ
jgi:Fe-S-cluster containining protein